MEDPVATEISNLFSGKGEKGIKSKKSGFLLFWEREAV